MIRIIGFSFLPLLFADCFNPQYNTKKPGIFQNVHSEHSYAPYEAPPKTSYDFGSGVYPQYDQKSSSRIKPEDLQPNIAEKPIFIQGGSLQTWTYNSPTTEQVAVTLSSSGRPINCDLELWNGPNNTPFKIKSFIENGYDNPFTAIIKTPKCPNTIAIKNTGYIEFPISCIVNQNTNNFRGGNPYKTIIQGGALNTWAFDSRSQSVEVMIDTEGRPISSRIELLQGPNNKKQVIELYSEDGLERPFWGIIKTPGPGCVIRVSNTATVEFPIYASVSENIISY